MVGNVGFEDLALILLLLFPSYVPVPFYLHPQPLAVNPFIEVASGLVPLYILFKSEWLVPWKDLTISPTSLGR